MRRLPLFLGQYTVWGHGDKNGPTQYQKFIILRAILHNSASILHCHLGEVIEDAGKEGKERGRAVKGCF